MKISIIVLFFIQYFHRCLVEGDRGAGARENRGREGYGRQDLYDGGKRERNSKRQAFVICYCLLPVKKKRTQQRFLTDI